MWREKVCTCEGKGREKTREKKEKAKSKQRKTQPEKAKQARQTDNVPQTEMTISRKQVALVQAVMQGRKQLHLTS